MSAIRSLWCRRRGPLGRHVLVSMAAIAAVGASAFGIGPVGLGARDACAAGADQNWPLVIDYGNLASVPGAPRGISVSCLPLVDGETGLQVLQAHERQVGLSLWTSNGLICGIDGYPSQDQGCASRVGDHFLYWSYWKGTDQGWSYQNVGPATRLARSGEVEGWRFVEGASPSSGTGLRPPSNLPDGRPSFVASNICAVAPVSTVAPPATTTGGAPPRPASGSSAGPGVATSPPAGSPPSGATGTGAPSGGPSSTRTSTGEPSRRGNARALRPGAREAGSVFETRETAPLLSPADIRRAAATHRSTTSGGDPFPGAVVAGITLLAIVVLAGLRSRRVSHR